MATQGYPRADSGFQAFLLSGPASNGGVSAGPARLEHSETAAATSPSGTGNPVGAEAACRGKNLEFSGDFGSLGPKQLSDVTQKGTLMKTLLSILSLASGLAIAQAQNFTVSLDPTQEANPVGGRTGSGIGNLTLTGTTLTLDITFSGLSSTFSADHIHGPAAATPSTTASVIYPLQSITTTSDGGHAGTIVGSVNLVPLQSGGYTVAQQLSDLENGLWYVNVHTSTFPGGEIRGQILPVPEPSTLALAGLGLGGLLIWKLRRRGE